MTDLVYRWKPQSNIGVDAQMAGERLEALRIRCNGQLMPRAVVEDARPPEAPLHECFEWNDAAAAEAYREERAGYVLNHITVEIAVPHREPRQIRAFVNVVAEQGRGYTSVAVALSEPELRRQMLARAMNELRQWLARYAEFAELAEIIAAVEAAIAPDPTA